MALRIAASVFAAMLAFPAYGCDISLPLSEGMFAELDAPTGQLTSLPDNAGAFEYLNENYLDTLRLTHSGNTFAWTARNTAATCGNAKGGRSCRVLADTETRFGKITLTKEDVGEAIRYRYRLLMVDGRRHVRLFPRPAATRLIAACNLMKAVDAFRRTWMPR